MKKELLHSLIYQVFVRDFTSEGTFNGVTSHLDEIQALGTDILYLMPIHPIGVKNRKGSWGSPYAIEDYEALDPHYGTEEDFKSLIHETHRRGMKLIIDVVYNHTSCDSRLSKTHPEWFYHDKNGNFGNRAGVWSDVIDLDHSHPELEEYLSDLLLKRVQEGVDGFRFDVASLIPPSFFSLAKRKCQTVNPNVIFLGETVDSCFLNAVRSLGFPAYSNAELFLSGLDMAYHYASWQWLREFLETNDEKSLAAYRSAFNVEAAMTPSDGIIVRAVENHDNRRIASYRQSLSFAKNLLAFSSFTRGPMFLYMGEEDRAEKLPSLFEKETIDWHHDKDYLAFVKRLIALKKRPENETLLTSVALPSSGETLLIGNTYSDHREYGFFNLNEKPVMMDVPSPLQGKTVIDLWNRKETTLGKQVLVDLPFMVSEKEK